MIEKIITGNFFTNSYIISNNDKCIIVDPGLDFSQKAEEIKKKYEVVAVLITHGHMDHIDGIRYFDVPIYIHELDYEFLSNPSLSLYKSFYKTIPFNLKELDIHLVKDNDIIDLLGYTFRVIHTPGHTRGSVCYLYKTKLLSGDTLFRCSVGRTDLPTGDNLKLRDSLKKIINICNDNTSIYPGHDELSSIKYERQNNPYINDGH